MCKGTVIAVQTLWINGLQFSFISSMAKVNLEITTHKDLSGLFVIYFFENQLLRFSQIQTGNFLVIFFFRRMKLASTLIQKLCSQTVLPYFDKDEKCCHSERF